MYSFQYIQKSAFLHFFFSFLPLTSSSHDTRNVSDGGLLNSIIYCLGSDVTSAAMESWKTEIKRSLMHKINHLINIGDGHLTFSFHPFLIFLYFEWRLFSRDGSLDITVHLPLAHLHGFLQSCTASPHKFLASKCLAGSETH